MIGVSVVCGSLNQTIRITFLAIFLSGLSIVGYCTESDVSGLSIIYSGDEQGQLWAHGCDEQVGGLDRRYTVVTSLRENRENALNIHTGGIPDPNDPNSEIVYQVALEALSMMNYDVVCLGPQDLCLPTDSLKALYASHPDVAFVCANIGSEEQDIHPIEPYTVRTFPGDIKVAIVPQTLNQIQIRSHML